MFCFATNTWLWLSIVSLVATADVSPTWQMALWLICVQTLNNWFYTGYWVEVFVFFLMVFVGIFLNSVQNVACCLKIIVLGSFCTFLVSFWLVCVILCDLMSLCGCFLSFCVIRFCISSVCGWLWVPFWYFCLLHLFTLCFAILCGCFFTLCCHFVSVCDLLKAFVIASLHSFNPT